MLPSLCCSLPLLVFLQATFAARHIVSVTYKFSHAYYKCFKHLYFPLFFSGNTIFKDFLALLLPQQLSTYFLRSDTCKVYSNPPRSYVCLSGFLSYLVVIGRVYFCLFLCLSVAFFGFFDVFTIRYDDCPPTSHIWHSHLIPNSFIDRISFQLIKFVRVLLYHQFWQLIWWSCLISLPLRTELFGLVIQASLCV